MDNKLIFLWLAVISNVLNGSKCYGKVIKTRSGKVRGYRVSTPDGQLIDAYLGIPYAAPPIGNKRFKLPEQVTPWNDVLNATSQPASCMQKPYPFSRFHPGVAGISPRADMNEDCLKLNLWVPANGSHKLSVLVFIFGGGFSRGGASVPVYDGATLAAEGNIIVVTFNYRLASFGFLYLSHPSAPGNMGLLDQVMMLSWLKTNIEAFGGNPNSITIFGHSAGSASVGYHLLSEISSELFNSAIMMSGSPQDVWAFSKHDVSLNFAAELVQSTGCKQDINNISGTIECLQNLDASELLYNEPTRLYDYVYNFVPVVDGYFIKAEPLELIRSGIIKNASIITGNVKDEGTIFLSSFLPLMFPLRDNIRITGEDAIEAVETLVGLNEVTIEVLQMLYLNADVNYEKDSSGVLNIAKTVCGDAAFVCSQLQIEDAVIKKGGTVHKYYFTHRSSNSHWPEWHGTIHGEDFRYIFGEPMQQKYNYTQVEKDLSKRMMTYWTNFAKTGDPNLPKQHEHDLIQWPRMSKEGREYLIMAPNSTAVGKHLRAKYCSFWNHYLPKIEEQLGPTIMAKVQREALFKRY